MLVGHDAPAVALPVPLVQGFATIDGRRFYTERLDFAETGRSSEALTSAGRQRSLVFLGRPLERCPQHAGRPYRRAATQLQSTVVDSDLGSAAPQFQRNAEADNACTDNGDAKGFP